MTRRLSYDYVVVGAGAAGCVVAARLASAIGGRVALLEAGPRLRSPWVHVPIGYARLVHDRRAGWGYATEAEEGLLGRTVPWPRGRLLGGSASINGLVFLRGAASDFDGWAAAGAPGWSYADVLPYFRRLERNLAAGQDAGAHGSDGPIPVSLPEDPSPVARAFVESCVRLGWPRNPDFNAGSLRGAGFLPMNVERGRRRTSAMTYLAAAGDAVTLHLRTTATRILLDGGCARTVEAVCNGERVAFVAQREIVLCAGAVNTPHLLMLSGIGPQEELSAVGIPLLRDLPVGLNLQDHLAARFVMRARDPITFNDVMQSPLGKLRVGLRYLLQRRGPLAVAASEASLFAAVDRVAGEPGAPDLQFQIANFSLNSYAEGLHDFPGFMFSTCVCRPWSRGRVGLDPKNPTGPPVIRANYLSDARDLRMTVAGLRLGREIAQTPPLRDLIAAEILPGPEVRTDADLADYVRRKAFTIFHPCGTARMDTGPEAVVDPSLRVLGVDGLRVADASVMPVIPSANIHAATLMIAEKAAALMLGRIERLDRPSGACLDP